MVFAVAPSEVASFPESHTSGQLKSSALADSLPAAAHLAARLGVPTTTLTGARMAKKAAVADMVVLTTCEIGRAHV